MCSGCNRFFCDDHYIEHRTSIKTEFDKLGDRRNAFKQELDDRQQADRLESTLCQEINKWEQLLTKQIQQLAEHTREQVVRILRDRMGPLEDELKDVSGQLQVAQKQRNPIERDIQKFLSIFARLQQKYQQITQSETVKVHCEQSDKIEWNCLLFLEDALRTDQVRIMHWRWLIMIVSECSSL